MDAAPALPAAADKISLRRIRLVLTRQRISANVGSFFAADRVLSAWAGRTDDALECEFEIVYDDGYTLAGEYRFRRKAAARPALMGFVRQAAMRQHEGSARGPLVRGLSGCPQGFLAHYEVADAMPAAESDGA